MNIIDCHNHSSFSNDSESSIEEMVNSARKKGVSVFAITDHCEINECSKQVKPQQIVDSISVITKLKQLSKYKDIKLIAGVEMGQPLFDPEIAKLVASLDSLDYIIASLHCGVNGEDYFFIEFDKMTSSQIYTLNEQYFIKMQAIASKSDFDILGHITYPFRYMQKAMHANPALKIDLDCYDEQIHEVLKSVVNSGKGIEINTSTIHANGEPLPPGKFIKMYKQLGGEILSIGSDAHTPDNVAKSFDIGYNIALDAGFKYVTYFENRKPVMVKIV